jgi:hypothetical protein
MNTNTEKLTLEELGAFKKNEREIDLELKGVQQGLGVVGMRFGEIRDKRQYRAAYGTWEEYCQKRWQISHQHADNLIKGAVALQGLPKNLTTMVVKPRQALALANVKAENRAKVLTEIKKSGEPVTAKSIAKKAAEVAKPDIELDRTGYPVPKGIAMALWNRHDEVQVLLTRVSQIKSALSHAQQNKDLLFIEVNFSSAIAYLENVFGHIKRAMPYAVCPACQGKLVEKCQLCKGRGLISELLYTQGVDEETKKLRMKAIKK